MSRLSLADELPTLLAPTRLTVFAQRTVGRGKKAAVRGVAWQGWNADATMEARMARLQGGGSFYWPNALRAYFAACDMMRADATITQVKVETISGAEVARIYR